MIGLILAGVYGVSTPKAFAESYTADVVVYGGTSAAITAAVQVKQMGRSVLIVCPDQHLGGLTSGGLGWTDTGKKEVIGGLSREFYHRVYLKYQQAENWNWQSRESYGNRGQGNVAIDGKNRTQWIFEPHIAEQVFDEWVSECEIPVYRDQWLDRKSGVEVVGGRIKSIRMLGGDVFTGKVFLDVTYEGDLMAAAGVSYHVGRESSETYAENWAGIQTGVNHHGHHFANLPAISPYVVPGDPASGVLPRVSADPPGKKGDADDRVQAYCFRMCLTDHPGNLVPFEAPKGYDPAEYELLARIYEAGWRETFNKFDPIPNRKTDTNNHGPMSTDNIGFNYDYPEASYERRAEIIREHENYQKGWLYFHVSDPRVPEEIREEMKRWGLAADEFDDNGHWPHQIYVREARRMIGQFVMTENELQKRRPTPQSVGMGSYSIDSHNTQRYITPEGRVQNEGDIGVSTYGPYEIAYGSLVPKADDCENLIVPVCVSSSHIAFGSIRMEPVFMILGQSAATAAVLAIESDLSVQEVPYDLLQQRLLADGQVLHSAKNVSAVAGQSSSVLFPKDFSGVVLDDSQASFVGTWRQSAANRPHFLSGYRHEDNAANGKCSAIFETKLPTGFYEIQLAYPPNTNRATNVPVKISSAGGTTSVKVNQRSKPTTEKAFTSLGVYQFDQRQPAKLTISNQGTDGYVIVDAVRFVPADPPPSDR
ncbi:MULTISPECIES: FAD-dependent oxidoreductase [Rhodopirellula]|uniref:FAD-dependent oxidoreductase n=1 Tax=Rhodopirellula sp. MGV TaxID=2023130 RepID=UPI000B9741D6|nr:FAD-dependent oxidoreductase [Rhodopirellula sp. MGV]PNY33801.1 FAD-dependent oxidoreductase [Rhodopirellula baltica]